MLLRTLSLGLLLAFAPLMAMSDQVPDFQGLTEEEAIATAQDAGFSPTVETLASAERVGRVFSQVPGAGSTLVGDEIVLRISGGVVVPVLTGQSIGDATSQLGELGIGWSIARLPELGLAPGLVARSEPEAGATLDASEEVVFLTVSTMEMVAVPDVVGTALTRATATLESLGLQTVSRAGNRSRTGDDPQRAAHWSCVEVSESHTVTATDPPAATELPKGSRVTLDFDTLVSTNVHECTSDGTKL